MSRSPEESDPPFRLNKSGGGANLSWKVIGGIIIATATAVWYAAGFKGVQDSHTAQLIQIQAVVVPMQSDVQEIKRTLDWLAHEKELQGASTPPPKS